MSATETAICERVRKVRMELHLSQPTFAAAPGITRDKLACIEGGSTPLRFGVARLLCREFNISQGWLAEGIGLPHPRMLFAEGVEENIPDPMLFSDAWHQYLRPVLGEERINLLKSAARTGVPVHFIIPADLKEKRWGWMVGQDVRLAMEGLPDDLKPELAQVVLKAMDDFHASRGLKRKITGLLRPKDWPKDRPVPIDSSIGKKPSGVAFGMVEDRSRRKSKTEYLDSCGVGPIVGGVTSEVPTWPQLKQAVLKLTAEHGMKSWLADELKVSRQALTNWLSTDDQGRPDAQNTLLLLRWVKGGGGKTKIPRK